MVKPSTDARFEKVFKDPRFKRISKKETKVKIDSRFQKMFTDERFHTKYTIDKRGKKVDDTEKEDLHKFYEVEENNKETIKDYAGKLNSKGKEKKVEKFIGNKKKKKRGVVSKARGLKKELEETEETEKEDDAESNDGELDFSDIRGQNVGDDDGVQESSDSSDTDIEEITLDEKGITHGWGELDGDARRIENAETYRLAVCNCDWDRISASDLYVLFNSFKPTGGSIRSVKIYMSEFGRERLKEEDICGPKELKESRLDSDEESDGEGNIEGSGYNMEKLREYQLNRLKYYYAVVECNDKETADKLYEVCDGIEYEMSGTRLDLRFVSDEITFDDEPTAVADERLNIKNYEPTTFLNTALQQSTVRLTWDESDPKRIQSTMRKFTQEDLENMDFKDYLASSSSEDEEEVKKRREKIKAHKKSNETKEITRKEAADEVDTEVKEEKENMGNENVAENTGDEFSDDDEEETIRKYRLLMDEINAKENKGKGNADDEEDEMNFTWNVWNVTGSNVDEQESTENDGNAEGNDVDDFADAENDDGFEDPFFQRPHEEGSKESIKNENNKNTARKQKKKKKKHLGEYEMTEEEKIKKNELELLLVGEEDDKKHFSLKGILEQQKLNKSNKRKRRKRKEEEKEDDQFEFNTKDDRFNALYDSHLYSIDPSEPNFKKTKATEAIIIEAQKRREGRAVRNKEKAQLSDTATLKNKTGSTQSLNLSALVNSVKSKTRNHQMKKKKKSKLK